MGSPFSGGPQTRSPMGVRITVGQIALHWMLCFAHSQVMALVSLGRAFRPFLEAAYAQWSGIATMPVCDETLMILPRLRSIILGANTCASRNGARRLTAMVRSHSSACVARRDCGWENAALLTRTSIAPKWASAWRAAARGPSTVARSASMVRHSRPASSTAARASSKPWVSRATATMSAPASARTAQISSPIPLEAPVISARRPVSEKRSKNRAMRPLQSLVHTDDPPRIDRPTALYHERTRW